MTQPESDWAPPKAPGSVARMRRSCNRLAPGDCVLRRYIVKRKIAQGGMGEVWAGEHARLRLRVAIKILLPNVQTNHEIVARFAREAFLLGQIHSDHVARAYDFSTGAKYGPVLVMEYVDGPALATVLRTKRFSIEEAIELGIDIASALRELHSSSIVHRDVKPANLIMRPVRDGARAVFVDLGVSRFVPTSSVEEADQLTEITTADRAVGTIEYMAPEQIVSSREVTPGADLWSLGAVLYRSVMGQNVFGDVHGASLTRIKLTTDAPRMNTGRTDRIARGFEEVVARALSRTPIERYEVADELLTDLCLLRDAARRAAADARLAPSPRGESTPPPRPTTPLPARARRLRWVHALIVLAIVTTGTILATALRNVTLTVACEEAR